MEKEKRWGATWKIDMHVGRRYLLKREGQHRGDDHWEQEGRMKNDHFDEKGGWGKVDEGKFGIDRRCSVENDEGRNWGRVGIENGSHGYV